MKSIPVPGAVPPAPRFYLLAGVFTAGAAVLALELVGSRVISPFYGSSLYSWAAIITVTMVALALGYALGGRAADRDPSPALFAKLAAAAGVAVAFIPLLRVPVLSGTASLGVRLGALASSAILLGPALSLLGSLGPVVVRLSTREVASVGRRSGEVMAVSTAGSVLGAVASGFFLIPNLRVPTILYGIAGLLFIVAAAGLWAGKGRGAIASILAAGAAGLLSLRPAPADGMLFAKQSPFGEVRVFDADGRRFLLVDGVTQSVARRARRRARTDADRLPPFETDSPYLHTLELAAAACPQGGRALFIGSGAGQLPVSFEVFHRIASDVVEIDPVMLEAAKLFGFPLPPGRQAPGGAGRFPLAGGGIPPGRQTLAEGGKVFVEDGRAFLQRNSRPYDIIILDAFVGENPPYHLFTAESFQAARKSLAPGGIVAANLVSLVSGKNDDAWVTALKTMRSVFPETRAYLASPPYKGLANIVFFCSDAPLSAALARARQSSREPVRGGSAFALSHELTPSSVELAAAPVLTDDFAPVESILARTALAWREVVQDTAGEAVLR
ncbi:MAG: fused MFS/spermidine synthase [Elusimicrobia bacterium]|nr:fused MFS/spermidine synthase [Elusimicrobiota bacterium]